MLVVGAESVANLTRIAGRAMMRDTEGGEGKGGMYLVGRRADAVGWATLHDLCDSRAANGGAACRRAWLCVDHSGSGFSRDKPDLAHSGGKGHRYEKQR